MRIILAVLLFFCGVACAVEYKSAEGNYTVNMPALPTEDPPDPVSPKHFNVSLNQGTYAMLVSYDDYTKVDPIKAMDVARDSWLKRTAGKATKDAKVELSGNPGRDIVIEATINGQDAMVKLRLYFVNQRLYQIIVVGEKDKVNTDATTQFLDSFKLNKK